MEHTFGCVLNDTKEWNSDLNPEHEFFQHLKRNFSLYMLLVVNTTYLTGKNQIWFDFKHSSTNVCVPLHNCVSVLLIVPLQAYVSPLILMFLNDHMQ